jgi:hypothetical protein
VLIVFALNSATVLARTVLWLWCIWLCADKTKQLQQQLRQAQQLREETSLQLHFAKDEAAELRQAKEAAVVEREQLAVRLERRSQQQQVGRLLSAALLILFHMCGLDVLMVL